MTEITPQDALVPEKSKIFTSPSNDCDSSGGQSPTFESSHTAHAFKSKANFEELMKVANPPEIISTLADYPKADGKTIIRISNLTQNIDTLLDVLADPMVQKLPKDPYIVWIVANTKDNLVEAVKGINKFAQRDFGIFLFKATLNEDLIEFKCLSKPKKVEKKEPTGKAKQIQFNYWTQYAELCDELGDGDYQVTPKPQHWQHIPMGKTGVSIQLIVDTKMGLIGADLLIGNNKALFAKLQSKSDEIEEQLGRLDWVNFEGNKSTRIRKTFKIDFYNETALENGIKTQIQCAKDFKETFAKYL